MKINIKIVSLLIIQLSIIFFSYQIISNHISENINSDNNNISSVPQGINQVNESKFRQIEQFSSAYHKKIYDSQNLFLMFLSLNLLSFAGITVGIMHFMKADTSKQLKTEKLAIVGTLAARINHDLRNPLSIIKNSNEILKIELENNENPKVQEILDRMERSILRMNHQIEDVLNFVRPSILEKNLYSLCMIIQDSIERLDIPDEIVIKLPTNDQKILCDNEKLEIVFVNMISNAIHALKNKGRIQIRIDDSKKDFVIVEIEDDGPGMDSVTKNQIFDPLFTTKSHGTGLGLPSCKSIIENHGGSISVSSELGVGTTFKIKLPKNHE
ncbi:MAG: GHKL domain-containing protein [Crenarchaeota archaeon]|nr:MAG: GHKL domain-containing protein [Thermoproteota archaeon]RDJ33220.1 MAG: GHKL domain-containing protein [Thermoproteota archaeon]